MRSGGRHAGVKLSGIAELKGSAKRPVVVCGSGTTLNDLDLSEIPDDWIVVAVNEAIRKLTNRADYWVHSDRPISQGYGRFVNPERTTVLAMHDAVLYAEQCCPKRTKIYTTMSHAVVKAYDDGTNFFSRGTVLIGAVEMLRYLGARKFYCFGLDCFRTHDQYYYDGRKHPLSSERQTWNTEQVMSDIPPGVRIWVTSRLKRMVVKLRETVESGLWEKIEIWCVNSPYSQQKSIPLMDMDEFREHVKRAEETRKRSERRRRAKEEQDPDGAPDEALEGRTGPGEGDAGGPPADHVDGGDGPEAEPRAGEPGRGHEGDPATGLRGDRDPHGGDVGSPHSVPKKAPTNPAPVD